jgi:carboxymethylenebutenolidase
MKKIITLLLVSSSIYAQTPKSCCSVSSTEKFAMLASNERFVSSHLSPLPFTFYPAKGSMVSYKTDDGATASAFEVKADKATDNWIIMVHEWWGLNDYIKQEAEKLQGEVGNANVLAVDLYDGKVGTNPEEAQKLMGAMKEDRAVSILKGALAQVGTKAHIATIGWCFGGGWSLQTALLAGNQADACVMYYGMPETNMDKLKKLHAPVLGIFAKQDQWITPAVVETFQKNMKEANKKLTVINFDADHAFANPSNPKYNKTAAADAHKEALAFLQKNLK